MAKVVVSFNNVSIMIRYKTDEPSQEFDRFKSNHQKLLVGKPVYCKALIEFRYKAFEVCNNTGLQAYFLPAWPVLKFNS